MDKTINEWQANWKDNNEWKANWKVQQLTFNKQDHNQLNVKGKGQRQITWKTGLLMVMSEGLVVYSGILIPSLTSIYHPQ